MTVNQNFYSSNFLDRVSHLRNDMEWLAEQMSDATSRLLPVWQQHNMVISGETVSAATLEVQHCEALCSEDAEPILLGLVDGTAYFTLDVSHIPDPHEHELLGAAGQFEDLRKVGPYVGRDEGSLLAYARGINYWHQRHRFCGVCGAPTRSEAAGHQRRCTNGACNASHFPRTDVACIMLVHDEDRIIMGKAPRFQGRMQSVLAGFLEPGETLEDCVAREVFEEVGVRVTDVKYQHSQPWPFPASLMVGFRARAIDTNITIDEKELLSAEWLSRSDLKAITTDSPVQLPRPDSIARRLIEEWLAED
ncbi:MAG: NAD(+) diphosphatase [Alphaproteobacteria bacterium]|nr:NAD(+) diphosphatase [Alphaproteobacteria bacterium]